MTTSARLTPTYNRLAPRPGSGSIGVIGPGHSDGARDKLRLAALVVLMASLFGIFAADFLMSEGFAQPNAASSNVYFHLFARHEPPVLWLLAVFALGVLVAAGRTGAPIVPVRAKPAASSLVATAAYAAVAVLLVTGVGRYVVMHGTLLSMDEFAAAFQARIIAMGRLAADVPVDWRGFGRAIAPHFIAYRDAEGIWLSSYLPGYAAIRALFSLVGAEGWLNPILAALSVVAIAGAAGRLWPGDARRGRLAILFLASSTQFLLMSMTGYAWVAHLCFNLVWLYLALRDDRFGLAAAPWVGALALGLHNPFPHALFVAPFLLRLLRTRRFGWIAYYGAVYGSASLAWYRLMAFAHSQVARGAAVEEFALPSAQAYFVQGMNFSLLLSWQAPAMAIALVAAFFIARSLKEAERDLLAGLALTFAFYFLFPQNQGHGWGYRYAYSALGNAALLAASTLVALSGPTGLLVRRLVVASTVAALAVQLPLRLFQAERFVRPYGAALQHIASRNADVVLVDPTSAYYGRDLVRNDPSLATRPITVNLLALQPSDVTELLRRYPQGVHLLTVPELDAVGMTTFGSGPSWVRR